MARQQATKAKAAKTAKTVAVRKRATPANPDWYRRLKKLYACPEALRFAAKYKTLSAAWNACTVGSWLVWLIERSGAQFKHTAAWAEDCACSNVKLIKSTYKIADISKRLNAKVKLSSRSASA